MATTRTAKQQPAMGEAGIRAIRLGGVFLILAAAAAGVHTMVMQNGGYQAGASANAAIPAPTRAVIFEMPAAHDSWQRTDYVGPEAATAALGRISSRLGLPAAAPDAAHLADAATTFYEGPGASFAIYIARHAGRTEWTPPSGATRIVAGRIFEDHAKRPGQIDLSLDTRRGMTVIVRGHGDMARVQPFLEQIGLWNTAG